MTTVTKEGLGIVANTYLPQNRLTNDEIEGWRVQSGKNILTSQGIYEKLGIRERPIAGKDETALSMVREALKGSDPFRIPDVLYFSSSYPDGVNNAREIANDGIFPISRYLNVHAACSGTALSFVDIHRFPEQSREKLIRIAAGEIYTPTVIDLSHGEVDASLAQSIFGDGAAYIDFREGEDIQVLSAATYNFPRESSGHLLMPIKNYLIHQPALFKEVPNNTDRFRMNGSGVYKAVVSTLPDLIERTVASAKLDPKDIRLIIPHQASKPMLDGIAGKLPNFDLYYDLEESNTSSVSILKAFEKALGEGAVRRGDRLVFAGFGGGLFAAVAVVQLN